MAATFSACEMKDELWGNANEGSATAGQLQLQLINNAQADETLKRAEATDNGIKVGVFDPEELDVNNYRGSRNSVGIAIQLSDSEQEKLFVHDSMQVSPE